MGSHIKILSVILFPFKLQEDTVTQRVALQTFRIQNKYLNQRECFYFICY